MIQSLRDLVSAVAMAHANKEWWAGEFIFIMLTITPVVIVLLTVPFMYYAMNAEQLKLMRILRNKDYAQLNKKTASVTSLILHGNWSWRISLFLVLVTCGTGQFMYLSMLLEAESKYGIAMSLRDVAYSLLVGVIYIGAGVWFLIFGFPETKNDMQE